MTDQDAIQPQLNIISQYVRRIVFENSAAISGKLPSGKPTINIQVNVEAEQAENDIYRVGLLLTIETMNGDDEIFAVELDYFGLFKIAGVPANAIGSILYVQCPTLLFPVARLIVASATREGGYAPLLLDPINFEQLYKQKLQQMQGNGSAEA